MNTNFIGSFVIEDDFEGTPAPPNTRHMYSHTNILEAEGASRRAAAACMTFRQFANPSDRAFTTTTPTTTTHPTYRHPYQRGGTSQPPQNNQSSKESSSTTASEENQKESTCTNIPRVSRRKHTSRKQQQQLHHSPRQSRGTSMKLYDFGFDYTSSRDGQPLHENLSSYSPSGADEPWTNTASNWPSIQQPPLLDYPSDEEAAFNSYSPIIGGEDARDLLIDLLIRLSFEQEQRPRSSPLLPPPVQYEPVVQPPVLRNIFIDDTDPSADRPTTRQQPTSKKINRRTRTSVSRQPRRQLPDDKPVHDGYMRSIIPQQQQSRSEQRYFEARGPKPLFHLLLVLDKEKSLSLDMLTALLIHFLPTISQRAQKRAGRLNGMALSTLTRYLYVDSASHLLLTPLGVLLQKAISALRRSLPILATHADNLEAILECRPVIGSGVVLKTGVVLVDSLKSLLKVPFKAQVNIISELAKYIAPLWKSALRCCSGSSPVEVNRLSNLRLFDITHWGYDCSNCMKSNMFGPRFHCETCSLVHRIDFDICGPCFLKKHEIHYASHSFTCLLRDVEAATVAGVRQD